MIGIPQDSAIALKRFLSISDSTKIGYEKNPKGICWLFLRHHKLDPSAPRHRIAPDRLAIPAWRGLGNELIPAIPGPLHGLRLVVLQIIALGDEPGDILQIVAGGPIAGFGLAD